jgi:hypothetical protein
VLVQAAHVALRQKNHLLHAWAWKLCLRKSHKNVAVAAVARKLTVSIWYCLRGLFQPLEKVDAALEQKIGRIATVLGRKTIVLLGFDSKVPAAVRKSARSGGLNVGILRVDLLRNSPKKIFFSVLHL